MSIQDVYEYLLDLEIEIALQIIDEWKQNKGNDEARQSWHLINNQMLNREYKASRDMGEIKVNVKNIEKMQNVCIENYLKLRINTILFGHDSINPFDYVSRFTDEFDNEKELSDLLDDFEWYAVDDSGNWRISDYGLQKIENCIIGMLQEENANKKLFWIDQLLSICHQRSDLSSWFVLGGERTLMQIFAQ